MSTAYKFLTTYRNTIEISEENKIFKLLCLAEFDHIFGLSLEGIQSWKEIDEYIYQFLLSAHEYELKNKAEGKPLTNDNARLYLHTYMDFHDNDFENYFYSRACQSLELAKKHWLINPLELMLKVGCNRELNGIITLGFNGPNATYVAMIDDNIMACKNGEFHQEGDRLQWFDSLKDAIAFCIDGGLKDE